ncbi:uncharacterized protein LOC111614517 [Centruroides sculpturatus]|uniref:uncharacterized protein LOC111614517 n=1 Tax=Centruroides sculpturatus TaxID=218467 RepID=UPI000C6E493A|nr:uncharacterized protein LOC111614517 [Centruroides sculpturatus]
MAKSNDKLLLANLKEILRTKVKLEDQTENIRILQMVLDELIKEMKTDKLFYHLFENIYYTGSYFEKLRVKEATEFDLNLILTFPKIMNFQVTTDHSPSSFVTCQLKSELKELMHEKNWELNKEILRKFSNRKNFLEAGKIKNWLQGIVDSAINKLGKRNNLPKIIRHLSGPAITIYIITKNGIQIDVDLVPVLKFNWPFWPEGAAQYFLNNIPHDERYWFIVPKLPPSEICEVNQNISYQWRLHFPRIEKKLIHDKGCLKSIIKLLKLLRDREGWKPLASYYLKTAVMWTVIIEDNVSWNESKMDILFLMVTFFTVLKMNRKY